MTDSGSGKNWPLEDLEGFQAALCSLLTTSRRHVCVYSEHLARGLYHEERVSEALSAFARSSRNAELRILVRDSDPIVQRFHRVHSLAQRLTSRIQIRRIDATVDTPDWEFVIGDGRLALVREDREQWQGIYAPDDPVRVRKLAEAFERDWSRATEDPALRRLVI